MILEDALCYLDKGAKIKRRHWKGDAFLSSDGSKAAIQLHGVDLLASDWEVVSELRKFEVTVEVQNIEKTVCEAPSSHQAIQAAKETMIIKHGQKALIHTLAAEEIS